jgi:hypothetical protein
MVKYRNKAMIVKITALAASCPGNRGRGEYWYCEGILEKRL